MNHQEPGSERRLLIVFGLTVLFLMAWPTVVQKLGWVKPTDPTTQHPQQSVEKPVASGIEAPLIPIKEHIDRSIETTSTKIGLSSSTASLARIEIKRPPYQIDPAELILLNGQEGAGPGAVVWSTSDGGTLAPWTGWKPVTSASRTTVTFQGEPAPGVAAEARYELTDAEHNAWTLTLSATNRAAAPALLQPRLLAGRLLRDPLDHGRYRLLRAAAGGKIHAVTLGSGVLSQRRDGAVGWVTAQTKYYTTILEPKTPSSALIITRDPLGQPQGWIEWPPTALPAGQTQTWTVRGYAGPLDYRFLDALQLDQATSLGAFSTIARLLQTALNGLTRWLRSYGAAIVTLTFLLSLLFYPLTWVSFRTMKKMELVQPEIKALQEKHKNDPKRLNEEVMKLYKQHQLNPLAGCLPLLLQMPLFIALYQVLSRSPELRGAGFLLIRDLSAPDGLIPLPATVPLLGSALNILPLAMAGMMVVQQRMTTKGRAATEEQRVQQQVFAFMPALFGVMFYTLPSGLVLYWLINTVLTVVQQKLILREFRVVAAAR